MLFRSGEAVIKNDYDIEFGAPWKQHLKIEDGDTPGSYRVVFDASPCREA